MKKSAPLICSCVDLRVGSAANARAQSISRLLKPGGPAAGPAATDQLGRGTPSGAVLGFLEASTGNEKAAADYLQMSAARRQSQGRRSREN